MQFAEMSFSHYSEKKICDASGKIQNIKAIQNRKFAAASIIYTYIQQNRAIKPGFNILAE